MMWMWMILLLLLKGIKLVKNDPNCTPESMTHFFMMLSNDLTLYLDTDEAANVGADC